MTEVLRDVVAGAIDIDYDSTYENAIVEAMSRLEEMGDLVDGELPVLET
jgi:hypothetical protein